MICARTFYFCLIKALKVDLKGQQYFQLRF